MGGSTTNQPGHATQRNSQPSRRDANRNFAENQVAPKDYAPEGTDAVEKDSTLEAQPKGSQKMAMEAIIFPTK